jgi:hypothetical protein
MKFAYADPPYYMNGVRHYGDHPEAHIWDSKDAHYELIGRLLEEYPDGWALSCNPSDLYWILPIVPDARVCAWVKTFHQIRPLVSVQYSWEPVLLVGGRKVKNRRPMVRDWIPAARTLRKGVIGSKPASFHVWILDLLAFDPDQDTIDDIFPGANGLSKILETYEKIGGK